MSLILKMKSPSVIKTRLGLQNGGPVHAFFTETCAKAMDKYVPFDEGILAGTVIRDGQPTNNVSVNTITYSQNYAKYVYYGKSKKGNDLNYQKDKHPLAGPYWDERMWSAEKDDVIRQVQNYMDSGGNSGI